MGFVNCKWHNSIINILVLCFERIYLYYSIKMPYRKPPSKAETNAYRKAYKEATESEKLRLRDAFRKKHQYYYGETRADVIRGLSIDIGLDEDEKSRVFGAFQIAEIRQLVKAHNRINDLVIPRKLNKKQIIDLIWSKGYRLDPDKRSIIQIRRPKKAESEVTVRQAMALKDNPDSSKRTAYSKKVK